MIKKYLFAFGRVGSRLGCGCGRVGKWGGKAGRWVREWVSRWTGGFLGGVGGGCRSKACLSQKSWGNPNDIRWHARQRAHLHVLWWTLACPSVLVPTGDYASLQRVCNASNFRAVSHASAHRLDQRGIDQGRCPVLLHQWSPFFWKNV